ncbi:TetR/AcrR family transcriptional regulator [Glycomyces sp. TRM65418]|uniref:TetR/AcrR family transcriptional regulator n=1 Tax=Glycomyces sp. TRM65418 TaxID=2867006 RepID=UPI001CE52122|nr:TetR/AcrR family transcriptional regulator [Glycomyces sp. TRM65418]MCC3765433.1 TetR/AcrR family transcriptional regulator [Glycomyces sp. TRM65418]QZD55043.1 TetR/AcrR family transcriptional regulator [Glycomyces sp. TRM65418]
MDDKLLAAAADVLEAAGWDRLTMGDVADRAGVSRATLWRQVGGKEELRRELVRRLVLDYRESMWPVLTAPGTGRERLRLGLEAMCAVLDRHLALLSAFDTAFHETGLFDEPGENVVAPLVRLVLDGVADGSLAPPTDPEETGIVVFNTVCWPYVHLRRHHGWEPERARAMLLGLVLDGMAGERA